MRRICELSIEEFKETRETWNADRIQCWADASDDEDEQIFRDPRNVQPCERQWDRLPRPKRQKRIYSRHFLLQARVSISSEPGHLKARRIEELNLPSAPVEEINPFQECATGAHVFDPALAATAFEAVLSWLEPSIARSEAWREKGTDLRHKEDWYQSEARQACETEEETSDESPSSTKVSPSRWWPVLLVWALLLFLSYVWQKFSAVQAARPSASFANAPTAPHFGLNA